MNIFLLPKAKVVYLHPFSSSLRFLKFWKQNLMYFGRNHVETKPILHKYYMPLILSNNS